MNKRGSLFPPLDLVELVPELDPYAILKPKGLPPKRQAPKKKAKKTARKKLRKR